MRDGNILEMNQRRAQNEVILYRQMTFLNTRLEAYETVLSSRLAMVRALIDPRWLRKAVNETQMYLMAMHDERMEASAKKAKEQEQKPKITIVGANGLTNGR